MTSFVFRTGQEKEVKQYLASLDNKLRAVGFSSLFFRGGLRRVSHGEYLFVVNNVFPRTMINVWGMLLGLAGSLAYIAGFTKTAIGAWALALLVVAVFNASFSKKTWLYTLRLCLRSKTRTKTVDCTEEYFRRLALGTA